MSNEWYWKNWTATRWKGIQRKYTDLLYGQIPCIDRSLYTKDETKHKRENKNDRLLTHAAE